jgi:hypothetical protein
MARVLYVRVSTAEHEKTVAAAHAARVSLQKFCAAAIREATDRWSPLRPPVAEACVDGSELAEEVIAGAMAGEAA